MELQVIIQVKGKIIRKKIPSLRQTVGSVVSLNPAQIALSTAPLSSFPELIRKLEIKKKMEQVT